MNSMVYYNTELSHSEQFKISSDLIHQGVTDEQVISMLSLSTDSQINDLIHALGESKVFWVYDYKSLALTIFEFNKLCKALDENRITLRFINEEDFFLGFIQSIIMHEKQIVSKRIKTSARNIKKKNGAWGRPAIDNETRRKIYDLYHVDKKTIREIAKQCKVSVGTASKYANTQNV